MVARESGSDSGRGHHLVAIPDRVDHRGSDLPERGRPQPQSLEDHRIGTIGTEIEGESTRHLAGQVISDMDDAGQIAIGLGHRQRLVMMAGHPDQAGRELPVLAEHGPEALVGVAETRTLGGLEIAGIGSLLDGGREAGAVVLKLDQNADIVDQPGEERLVGDPLAATRARHAAAAAVAQEWVQSW